MQSIVSNYKDKYEFLNSPLMLTSLGELANTKFYSLTETPERYLDFLKKLECSQAFRNALDYHKDFLIHKTVCVNSTGVLPMYMFTQDKIVICIPEISNKDLAKHILGSVFFVRVGNISKEHLLKYVSPISFMFSKLIVKGSTRVNEESEVLPQVAKLCLAWLLKIMRSLDQRSLLSRAVSIGFPFSNAMEVNSVIDKISECKLVSDFLRIVATLCNMDPNQVKVSLVMKQGVDFALGLEDVAHAAYSAGMAHYFLYPANLYFSLKPFNENFILDFYKDIGIIFSSK